MLKVDLWPLAKIKPYPKNPRRHSDAIAAEMTGRRCYAVEIAPAYVQVAIERWQQFTGKQATLNGKPFAKVAAERQQPSQKAKKAIKSIAKIAPKHSQSNAATQAKA